MPGERLSSRGRALLSSSRRSTYREDIQDYRHKSKSGDLLTVAHELHSQVREAVVARRRV